MIRQIAHRANISGPNPEMENKPEYIQSALKLGYDVEVDVWKETDGFYLGHDKPQYKIEREFLRDSRIWSHCKNSKAFLDLVKYQDVNCFFQIDEEYVIT